jgi:hypothetical protein
MEERARHSRLRSRSSRSRVNIDLDYAISQEEASQSHLGAYSDDSQESYSTLPKSPNAVVDTPKANAILLAKRPLDTSDDVLSSIVGDSKFTSFPFMKLPTELRLAIYRKAFVRNKAIPLRSTLHSSNDHSSNGKVSRPAPGNWTHRQSPASRPENGLSRLGRDGGRKRRKVSKGSVQPSEDALVPQLLAVCQTIHHEARPVLYSENTFELELSTAIQTLMSLSQPSRSLIKHINLSVPTHHDIIEGFTDLVRLGLRYCWGLERLNLTLPPFAPTTRQSTVGTTNVYANSFQILRWLPQKTVVILDGGRTEDIDKVIEENQRMSSTLDKVGAPKIIVYVGKWKGPGVWYERDRLYFTQDIIHPSHQAYPFSC